MGCICAPSIDETMTGSGGLLGFAAVFWAGSGLVAWVTGILPAIITGLQVAAFVVFATLVMISSQVLVRLLKTVGVQVDSTTFAVWQARQPMMTAPRIGPGQEIPLLPAGPVALLGPGEPVLELALRSGHLELVR